MNDRFLPAVLLCVAGSWLGFANPVFHLPGLVLILPLVLGWLAIQASSLSQAFCKGWMAATAAYAAGLYWVSIPVHDFGSLPWIAALPCPLLLGLYLGLYAGLFCLVVAWAAPRLHWSLLCLGGWSAWTCLEYTREVLFTGFPWLGLAQAFAPWPAALQGASLIGAHGLSGFFTALALGILLGFEHKWAWLAAGIAVCGLAFFGTWHLQWPVQGRSLPLKTVMIQGNIDQSLKWDPTYQKQTLQRYLDMSRRAIDEQDAQFLIWPETALPFYLQEESDLTAQVQEFCRKRQVALLTGAPGYSLASGSRSTVYHNQAYLMDTSGLIQDVYGKQHLVPFGEYIPFGRYLPFVHKLVHGVGDFRPGRNSSPLTYQNLAMGGLICYETIFSGLVQQRVAEGANILVNISNDAWFGRSSGALQHLNQAVLRSVEQGRYMLRATNTGISALIDPKGRITHKSGWFTAEIIPADGLKTVEDRTFFSRYFQFVQGGFFLVLAILLLTAGRERTANRRPGPEDR